MISWGIDCGSTEIKVVACDAQGKLLHTSKTRTLFPLLDHVQKALQTAAAQGGLPPPGSNPDDRITATGYGRAHLPFAQEKLTEIKAHFLGAQALLGEKIPDGELYTHIDIGGQDSKIISARKGSQVDRFVINRKCAAGTGAYIEELAHRLQIPIGDLTQLEAGHDRELVLNSFCTVFAGQEVIKILMNGERVENLIHALYQSVVKRILEMAPLETRLVVFSGGVLEHHPALRGLFEKKFPEKQFLLAPHAQYCGALGAALFGMGRVA